MITIKTRTKAVIAGISLATMLLSSPLKAETKLSAGANTFAGYHQTQGNLIGGGIRISAGEKTSFRANLDIASLALKKPEIYSYGVAVNFPLSQNAGALIFCAKDGIIGTPGCGGWLTLEKGNFTFGAGSEYRTNNAISIKTSIASKIKIAFLKIKAKLIGYINTKDKDDISGGADLALEVALRENFGVFSRYNYFTKGDILNQHAVVGGLKFDIDYK